MVGRAVMGGGVFEMGEMYLHSSYVLIIKLHLPTMFRPNLATISKISYLGCYGVFGGCLGSCFVW